MALFTALAHTPWKVRHALSPVLSSWMLTWLRKTKYYSALVIDNGYGWSLRTQYLLLASKFIPFLEALWCAKPGSLVMNAPRAMFRLPTLSFPCVSHHEECWIFDSFHCWASLWVRFFVHFFRLRRTLLARVLLRDNDRNRPERLLFGDEAESKCGILSLRHPIEHGVVTNWDDMEITGTTHTITSSVWPRKNIRSSWRKRQSTSNPTAKRWSRLFSRRWMPLRSLLLSKPWKYLCANQGST